MAAMLRFMLLVFTCCFSIGAGAQFTEVQIGVNGLTCSQCTRSVEMRLRQLGFVQQVQMDLEHTNGKITINENTPADMDKIARAVADAGFSLRYLIANFTFNHLAVTNGTCFEYAGNTYQFVKLTPRQLHGKVEIHFVGTEFIAKKDLKKWQPLYKKACEPAAGKLYYVTL